MNVSNITAQHILILTETLSEQEMVAMSAHMSEVNVQYEDAREAQAFDDLEIAGRERAAYGAPYDDGEADLDEAVWALQHGDDLEMPGVGEIGSEEEDYTVKTPPPFAAYTLLILALDYHGMMNYHLEFGDNGPEEWAIHVNMGPEMYNSDSFAAAVFGAAASYAGQLGVKFDASRIGVHTLRASARFGNPSVIFSS